MTLRASRRRINTSWPFLFNSLTFFVVRARDSVNCVGDHILRPSALAFAGIAILALQVTVSAMGADPASAALKQPISTETHFWSFRPLQRPAVPRTADQSRSAIDRFILAPLEERGLSLARVTDRRTLCRRLYLDLTGLPPSPAEVELFLSDASSNAVEKLVDRLLASPHYGERWGQQWLDVTGYADSNGYIRHDSPRPLAYRYRDYVIQSHNEDKPYDRFWLEQLAGDELVGFHAAQHLSSSDVQTLCATHFLRNAPDGTDNTEGNETTRVIERYAVLEGQLQTTMSAMFGMTIDCARCHDHKFDPISQRDYYALQSIFYPAFNVIQWVQPKDRWIYAAGQADVAAWRASMAQVDQDIIALKAEHRTWLAAHRPAGPVLWQDDFTAESLATNWSSTAPGDRFAKEVPRTKLDSQDAPAARVNAGKLELVAAPGSDSRWLATQRKFDWTPAQNGHWIQVTFDLVASHGANGQPAERIGYYIALHDYDDNSDVPGGNILVDGNPAGGAGLYIDYPGIDQQGLGTLGTTGYLPGHNFGVRISRVNEREFLMQHVVDGVLEEKSIQLQENQLPDGAFGFELCCSRSFTVDKIIVESSLSEPAHARDPEQTNLQAEFARQLDARNQQLAMAIAAANTRRMAEPEKIAWTTDLSDTPPAVHLLKRGDYFQPGDEVEPGPLSVLIDADNTLQIEAPAPGAKTTGRRLAFARWATRPGSRAAALLARVQVDRIWRGHFGRGLVPTPENFGVSGVKPTHPELLEWLTAKLVDGGWRQKELHRAIVLSRTYQQESVADPIAPSQGAPEFAYSHFPAHRLEAEQIRDSMLTVAGVLNRKNGGPAVETVDLGNRQIVLPKPTGAGPHEVDRRSIYIRHRRSQPLSFLRVFDQANPEPNCVARGTSTVVAQSLAMLNSEFAQRMGEEFANRVRHEAAGLPIEEQVRYAFQVALTRDPSEAEASRCRQFLLARADSGNAPSPEVAQHRALADLCRLLLATNEFLYLQ